jgi:DNA-binding transcriptional regulator YiaG
MKTRPVLSPALLDAMGAYRAAVAAVEAAAGGAIEARPVFLLDARSLRTRASADALANLELARREARTALHRAAEAAALDQVAERPPSLAPAPAPAPARAREEDPAPTAEEGEPWHVRIRLWREREGINQAAAAARIGTGKSTWSTWELGTSGPPKPDTIRALADLTGIPTAAFLAVPRG